MRTGVQPGSFDPPTLAHLAIAHAALRHHRLDRVIWTVSRRPLGKDDGRTDVDDRLTVLHSVVADHRWLAAEATDARLVADIADGYDVVIMGADKWHQLHDPTFYGGPEVEPAAAMDRALERLPHRLAPRPVVAGVVDLVEDHAVGQCGEKAVGVRLGLGERIGVVEADVAVARGEGAGERGLADPDRSFDCDVASALHAAVLTPRMINSKFQVPDSKVPCSATGNLGCGSGI